MLVPELEQKAIGDVSQYGSGDTGVINRFLWHVGVEHMQSVADPSCFYTTELGAHQPGTNIELLSDRWHIATMRQGSRLAITGDAQLGPSLVMDGWMNEAGDGSCAFHSVFGHPNAQGELYAPHARTNASFLFW